MIMVFNKIDIVDHQFAINWMTNAEEFDEACRV